MKNNLFYLILCFFTVFMQACGGGSDDPTPEEPATPPSKAVLIFPEDNTECNEGINLSEVESSVTFRWNPAENTNSYTVVIRNLLEGTTQSVNTTANQQAVTLLRATPYSWSVISRSDATSETATSAVWKFYNAGASITNYAPFPAALVSPKMGSTVNSGDVLLSWTGEDIDDDITSYDVFLDTNNPPQTKIFTESSTPSVIASTESTTVYYWYVLSRDTENNTSTSEIFEFRTN